MKPVPIVRGSRKHVLDWTDQSEFPSELARLVSPVDAVVTAASIWMPRGYTAPQEARLEDFGPRAIPKINWSALRAWWLRHEHGANTPNWDIAVTCDIEGLSGLVLVEAKANVPELGAAGKPFRTDASQASRENHDQIGNAIAQACAELRVIDPGVAITRDSHYQLSNRVAFAWKLASLGIPTVVMYLGFIGDEGIRDAGPPFESDAHWRQTFAAYASSVLPLTLTERRITCGGAPMWLLVRSRPIREISPPAARGDDERSGIDRDRPV